MGTSLIVKKLVLSWQVTYISWQLHTIRWTIEHFHDCRSLTFQRVVNFQPYCVSSLYVAHSINAEKSFEQSEFAHIQCSQVRNLSICSLSLWLMFLFFYASSMVLSPLQQISFQRNVQEVSFLSFFSVQGSWIIDMKIMGIVEDDLGLQTALRKLIPIWIWMFCASSLGLEVLSSSKCYSSTMLLIVMCRKSI